MHWLDKRALVPITHQYDCREAMNSGEQWKGKVSNAAYDPCEII